MPGSAEGGNNEDGLDSLEIAILRGLRDGRSLIELSKLVKNSPQSVGQTLARLQLEGYLSGEGELTDKGRLALGA